MKYRILIKKNVQASFTIEAAVVIPIVLVLFAALIFLTFFAHDSITIHAAGTAAVLEQAEAFKDKKLSAETREDTDLLTHLLVAEDASLSISETGEGLTASLSAGFHVPLLMVRTILGDAAQNLRAEINLTHLDARKEILGYKALTDIMGD